MRRMAFTLSALVAMALSLAAGPSPSLAEGNSAPALRQARGEPRFIRAWQFLGPLPLALDPSPAAGEGALRPSQPLARPGHPETRWVASQSWGDIVDVAGAIGAAQYRGADAAPEAAYAHAIVTRERAGDALLSLGADGGVRVWINSVLAYRGDGHRGFSFDAIRAPVHFNQGENHVLIKLEHRTGPWRFALRVLEPGQIVARRGEIVPAIVGAAPGELAVRTGAGPRPDGAPVRLDVVAAGGRIVASREAARGEVVRLDPSPWPDGAYEIRLTTTTAFGARDATFLPWYKGDALAAARRLVDAASAAPADADGAHIRMLAAMALDRVGGDLGAAPADVWPLLHSPLMEYEEIAQARAGGPGPLRPSGFVRLAWVDEVDGSTQYCRAFLPPGYGEARRWPLVLSLHGFNPPNPDYVRWWAVDARHDAMAERHDLIWVEAHGRGNAQYLGIGERDVLRCLDEARRRLSVDADRVYLTGESMGGSGTWLIGSRHPDLFAAIAPVFGGWDYRVVPAFGFSFTSPETASIPELFAQETQSSFAGAEGLLNLPVFVHHGDRDQAVSVEFSRHIVRMLQLWGYDVRYEEHPGAGHEDLGARDRIVDWMLARRRVAAPPRVRIRSVDLAGASAYWVSVRAWEAPLRMIGVDAEMIAPGLVRLDTENVSSLVLAPPPELRGAGDGLRVVWNGQERLWPLSADGAASLTAPAARAAAAAKRPGLEGQLSSIVSTPFALIVGTSSRDPEMRRLCREKAALFAELWMRWQHVRPRLIDDRDLTPADERNYSLLLVGGADANLVARRLLPRLPLQVRPDSVAIDGRALPASDAVVQMIYPSPDQAGRYVLVVAATSTAGMYFWNPAGLWNQTFGFPALVFDWTIQDGRSVALANGMGVERGWVAAGMFDRNWRGDDRWVFPGDAALRARGRLRHPPAAGFTVGAARLETYVGRYQLAPGFFISVTRDGDGLSLQIPGSPPDRLIAESETDFARRSNMAPISFQRDQAGRATGLVGNNEGQLMVAPKVD